MSCNQPEVTHDEAKSGYINTLNKKNKEKDHIINGARTVHATFDTLAETLDYVETYRQVRLRNQNSRPVGFACWRRTEIYDFKSAYEISGYDLFHTSSFMTSLL